MSSDRLKELLRQRALLAEHQAWLDREIADLQASSGTGAPRPTPPAPAPEADSAPPARLRVRPADPAPAAGDVDALFERFQTEEKGQGQISRQGCWLVFAALMLVALAGITALIFVRYR